MLATVPDLALQHASRRVGQHLPVTLACGAVNLLWLLPLAALVALGEFDRLTGVLIDYEPLAGLGVTVMAGAAIGTLARVDAGAIVNAGAVVYDVDRVGAYAHLGVGACMGGWIGARARC